MRQRLIALGFLIAATTVRAQVWIRGDLPLEPVHEVAAHPTLPAIALATTDSGTYRTVDGGSHWQRVADFELRMFSFNPFREEVCADSAYGIAGVPDSGGMYCSPDIGVTWSKSGPSAFSFLLFDPRIPDRMYSGVGYGNRWIAVSDDHGKTWTVHGYTTDTHPNFHGWAAIDRDSTLYLTSYPHGASTDLYWAQPVYRSADGGDTWQSTTLGGERWLVAVDAMKRSTIYGAYNLSIPPGGVHDYVIRASTDGSRTWEERGHLRIGSYVEAFAADRTNNAILYVGGDSGMVHRSPDGGRSWIRIDHDYVHESATSDFQTDRVHIISVGIDGTVYVATSNAVFAMRTEGRKRAAR
jgi:photosystem II stability/assembly factor-like uncharacterized protein